MFKASPSKSMSEHLTKMGRGKSKKHLFTKKGSEKKGKFSLFKKKVTADSGENDHDFAD